MGNGLRIRTRDLAVGAHLLQDAKMFPSQLFVFGEKLRTRAVTAHQMSMVSGLQLLLFGSRTVTSEFKTLPSAAGAHGGGSGEVPLIKLDDW